MGDDFDFGLYDEEKIEKVAIKEEIQELKQEEVVPEPEEEKEYPPELWL
jgi:hypothetical protein